MHEILAKNRDKIAETHKVYIYPIFHQLIYFQDKEGIQSLLASIDELSTVVEHLLKKKKDKIKQERQKAEEREDAGVENNEVGSVLAFNSVQDLGPKKKGNAQVHNVQRPICLIDDLELGRFLHSRQQPPD